MCLRCNGSVEAPNLELGKHFIPEGLAVRLLLDHRTAVVGGKLMNVAEGDFICGIFQTVRANRAP